MKPVCLQFSEIAMSSLVKSEAGSGQSYLKELEKVEYTWRIKDFKDFVELGKSIKSVGIPLNSFKSGRSLEHNLYLELEIDKSSFKIYLLCKVCSTELVFRSTLRIERFKFEGSQTVGSCQKLFEHPLSYMNGSGTRTCIGSGSIEPIPQEMVICLELSALKPASE